MTTETYFLCRRITKAPEHDGATGYEIYEPVQNVKDALAIRLEICKSYAEFTAGWLGEKPKLDQLMMIGWAVNHLVANALDVQEGE